MTDIELGWTAGIIDGEGTISLGKSHQLQVAVGSCTRIITKTLYDLWGGSEWQLKRKTVVGKSIYRWQMTGKEARSFLIRILFHLILKADQATLAIAFGSTLGTPGKRISSEIRAEREELANEIRELKRCG